MHKRSTRNTYGDKPGHFPARSASRTGDAGSAYAGRQRKEARQLTYAVASRSGWVSVSNEARIRTQALEKPFKGNLYDGFYDPLAPRLDYRKKPR